jgi:hypothetical protein
MTCSHREPQGKCRARLWLVTLTVRAAAAVKTWRHARSDALAVAPWFTAALALAVLACASTELEAGPRHPASPNAESAPLPRVGDMLDEKAAGTTPPASSSAAPNVGHAAHGPSPTGAAPEAGAPAAEPTPARDRAAHDAPNPSDDTRPQATQWTCPMHPEVVRSEPGKCPICGMKLVPRSKDSP